jgi:hypothetical protein
VAHCTGDGEIAFEHASKRGCEAKKRQKIARHRAREAEVDCGQPLISRFGPNGRSSGVHVAAF